MDDELQQELLQAVRQIEKLSESIGALLDVTIGEGGVDGAKEWAQLHEDRASAYGKIRDLLSA